jgi:hypothetical protein
MEITGRSTPKTEQVVTTEISQKGCPTDEQYHNLLLGSLRINMFSKHIKWGTSNSTYQFKKSS